MNLNDKKTAKQLIKLACSIGIATKTDLMILFAMTAIKLQSIGYDLEEYTNLSLLIETNPHLMALMRVKNKD